jgi:hypothetical protein
MMCVQVLRPSSLAEYANWYLQRDARKRQAVPVQHERVEMMWKDHEGKMRRWFTDATWSIVLLNEHDFSNLIFLESCWTTSEGLVIPDGHDYRLLKRVAQNALKSSYLTRASDSRHKDYYVRFANGNLKLLGEERITLCSAEGERELNPTGQYYILDGAGRSLPYLMLVLEGKQKYEPVEAFVAEREPSHSKA